MRKYFISDIHGYYKPMMELFKHVNIDFNRDQLVFGGDYIDRGPDSGLVLQEVKHLTEQYPNHAKSIIGNHEEMMLWYLRQQNFMWTENGGIEAIHSINSVLGGSINEYVEWIGKLPLYIEDDEFLYSHAGFRPTNLNARENLWLDKDTFYSLDIGDLMKETGDKRIVHGHTPGDFVTDDGYRVSCDLGMGMEGIVYPTYSGNSKLALVELTEGIYFEYDFKTDSIEQKNILIV